MKKHLLFTLSFCLTLALNMNAQVKPSAANLKHFYDFKANYPKDLVGGADGDINEIATIHNGLLDLSDTTSPGGFASFPGKVIALNTYEALTIEAWATPSSVANSGNAIMMWSFGTLGNPGLRYFFFTPARWGVQTACRMSIGSESPWANEDGLSFDAAIGDSALHHYIVTLDADRILKLYVDNELLGTDTMGASFVIDSISNDTAMIGKSVYSPDPTWKGTVDLYAIWNTALTEAEIQWLFEAGKDRALITSGINSANTLQGVRIYSLNNCLYVQNIQDDFKDISLTIYNLTGTVVYKTNNFRNGSNLNLENGLYIIKVENQDNSIIQKVIIK